jgi:hypothetical protein
LKQLSETPFFLAVIINLLFQGWAKIGQRASHIGRFTRKIQKMIWRRLQRSAITAKQQLSRFKSSERLKRVLLR